MESKTYLPPPSEPDTAFWKGFFFGTIVGMVFAVYSYVATDLNFGRTQARLASVKSFERTPAA